MKRILIILIFTFIAADAGAQGIERMRRHLAQPDPANRARIEIAEQPDAAASIAKADHVAKHDKVTGYRVNLFLDNSQTAGENARAVAAQFQARFPHIPVQTSYESPYFKVTAGNFIDKVDAIALCGRVLGEFPKAFVAQETISLSEMTHQQFTGDNHDNNKTFGD